MESFRKDLAEVINFHSKETGSNTSDFILADYLNDCLDAFDKAIKKRESLSEEIEDLNPATHHHV